MGKMVRVIGLAAVIGASVSCGDVVREGRAPVFLVIDSLLGSGGDSSGGTFTNTVLSDVQTLITSPAPCTPAAPCPTVFNDSGRVTLHLVPKDIGTPTAPTETSTNNTVVIKRYRVVYRRADGHNTPGVDVPFGFDGAITGSVPPSGSVTMGFELVRHVAKSESPLVQLISNPAIITSIADVTFYGEDLVGNAINVTGSIQVDFGNFGDF